MHWPSYVEKTFYNFCESADNCPPELIKSLKNSPRTKVFLHNLSEEISKAERLVTVRRGRPLKLSTIQATIWDMSRLLLRGIEREATKRIQSEAEKKREQKEADYLKDLEATVDGNPQGEFEELEVTEIEPEEDQTKSAKERI